MADRMKVWGKLRWWLYIGGHVIHSQADEWLFQDARKESLTEKEARIDEREVEDPTYTPSYHKVKNNKS